MLERAVTREGFAESGQLPDWLSPEPKLREALRLVKKGLSPSLVPRHSSTSKIKPSI